jgi:hypothetical protein
MEQFDAFPTDAAVAFVKAMINLYGWASPQSQQTFFGSRPPAMMTIKTGVDAEDVIQCPLGQFKLPGCSEPITSMIHSSMGFIIHGEIKKKDRHRVLEIATETRRILKHESIYRGKAIRLNVDDEGALDTSNAPEFMNVSNTREADLLFDPEIMGQIKTNLLTPIQQTRLCRENNIPLKRGVLLEGPFGTGKTLTARLTAATCERHGWTFVLLTKVQGLKAALEFANRYAPAVVFAEDIDRIIEERTESANDLVNTIDGVISKTAEIMTVLTTNHADKINPVMLRPGRLDAVISLRAPSVKTVEKLLRFYAGTTLPHDEPLDKVCKEMAGQIPASIRECVERAKLGMVSREDTKLAQADLLTAALSMKAHLALLEGKKPEISIGDKLATTLRDVVNGNVTDVAVIAKQVDEIHDRFMN